MLQLIRPLFLLIILLSPIDLVANCLGTKAALETEDISVLRIHSELLEECQQYQDSLAMVYHDLGRFYKNINLDSSIHFTYKALQIRKEIFKEKPTVDLGKSYHNLGYFYIKNNQTKAAKEVLNKAIEIYKPLDVGRMLGSYLALGNVYDDEGEIELAENCFQLVIKKGKAIKDTLRVGKALLNLGGIKLNKKQYKKAIQLFEEAQPFLRQMEEYGDEAMCFQNIGIASYRLNDFSKAINNYKEAIGIFKDLEDCYQVGKISSNLGLAFQKYGNSKEALITLQKALQVSRDCGDPEIIASSHDNLGEYFLEKNEFQKALAEFQNAIKTLIPVFKPKNDFENPKSEDLDNVSNKIDLLVYLSDKGRALKQLGGDQKNLSFALEAYQLGDVLIDQLRKEHSDQTTKLFWREEVIPFYEKAIEICYDLQDGKNAFFFFEKSKAILLLEALQNADALAEIPDSTRKFSYELKRELIEARQDLEDAKEEDRSEKLQYLLDVQKSFDDFNVQLSNQYPPFAAMKFENAVIALSDFKKLLEKSPSSINAVHYFYGQKNIYALATDQSKAKVYNLGKTKEIEQEIRKLLGFFKNASEIENAPRDYIRQAHKVYRLVVEPLEIAGQEELLFFPAGALAYLPFEALTAQDDGNISTASYLIKSHVIRYSYSATILAKQKNNSTTSSAQNTIAAFAPFAKSSANPAHPVLSFSEDELGQIEEQVAGIFLKDQEASQQSLLNLKNKHAVLHLSTHAFSSPSESKPKIIFADSALYLSELYSLDIPSDLVVLSACQTNIGRLSPGEGVMSLGRGFTYAGARSLISSLWNVNANSTGQVLAQFYKNLHSKTPKHLALHMAKKSFLENENLSSFNRSPYYWAGLVYYGNAAPLDLKQPGFWNTKAIIIVFVILAFLAGFFFYRKYNT